MASFDAEYRKALHDLEMKHKRLSRALADADLRGDKVAVQRLVKDGARIDPAHGHVLRLVTFEVAQSQGQNL